MEKVLFVADAHVKQRTWVNHVNPQGDSYAALAKLSRANADTLIIGGDFFDSNRPSSTDEVNAVEFLSGFKRVLYIRGNHDNVVPSYLEALVSKIATVELVELTTEAYRMGDVDVYGISWVSDRADMLDQLEQIASKQGDLKYVVLHTSFEHLLPVGKWQLSVKDIESIFEGQRVNILVGDIHTRHTLDWSGGYIHSPGSIYPTSFPKEEKPYCGSLIDLHTGGIEDVDCTVRSYVECPYTDNSELKALCDSLKGKNPLPAVIRLLMPSDAAYSVNPVDYPDSIILCQKALSEQFKASSIGQHHEGVGMEEAIRLESQDEMISSLAVTLYAADDPLQLLDEWLSYWKVERMV